MTEQDLFEQRLRAALRRHTADAPVEFDALDFAHAAATRAPRRRGLARVVAWRPRTRPDAGLGPRDGRCCSPRSSRGCSRRLAACARAPGRGAADRSGCSPVRPGRRPTSRGPVDQARPPDLAGDGIRPPGRQAVAVALAGDRSPASRRGRSTCARTPGRGCIPSREPPARTGRARVRRRLRPDDPGHLPRGVGLRPPGRHLDAEGIRRPDRRASLAHVTSLAYDPVTGLVVAAAADARTRVPSAGAVELRRRHRHVDPDPPGSPAGRRTSRGALRLRRLRRPAGRIRSQVKSRPGSGSGTRRGSSTSAPGHMVEVRRRHAAHQEPLGVQRIPPGHGLRRGSRADSGLRPGRHSAAYDSTTDRWESPDPRLPRGSAGRVRPQPECRQMPQMVYDPVNQRLVGRATPKASGLPTGAGRWTVLLEPDDRVERPR